MMNIKILTLISTFLNLAISAQAIESVKKLKDRETEIRESMIEMSRQLSVTCTKCHNVENFRSDEKREFKVGKEHMKLVQILIDNGMNGQKNAPKADCYMCHRGKLIPDYKEPKNEP